MDIISPPESVITECKGIFKPEEITTMLVSRREKNLEKIADQIGIDIDIRVKVVVGKDFREPLKIGFSAGDFV